MVAVDEMMYYTLSLGRAVRDLKNVGKYLAGASHITLRFLKQLNSPPKIAPSVYSDLAGSVAARDSLFAHSLESPRGLNLTEAALCILSVLDEDQFPESIWRFDFMMSLSPRFHGESMCIPHEVIDNSDLVAAIVR